MSQSPVFNTCDICRHWDNDGMSPYGVCRKSPPTGSGWPRVSRKDWCGEWDTWVALPVSNPLPLSKTVEANHAQAEAYAASKGLPPPYNPTLFPNGPDFNLSPPEKRRPGRPRKVEA